MNFVIFCNGHYIGSKPSELLAYQMCDAREKRFGSRNVYHYERGIWRVGEGFVSK